MSQAGHRCIGACEIDKYARNAIAVQYLCEHRTKF